MQMQNDKHTKISKKFNSSEDIIFDINQRLCQNEKAETHIVFSIEKITDQLSVVFQKLKNNDEKIKEIEEVISPIKLIKSHWKLIMWIVFTSSSLGFAFDGGVKNIMHFIDKYKIASVSQNIIRNERNGG
jgi:hypothetical protein